MSMISELRRRIRENGTATITAEEYDQLQREWITRSGAEETVAAERHACEIAVWLVRMEAEKPDAPDEGISGWLQAAEDAIRMRSNVELTGAAPSFGAASSDRRERG